MTDARRCPSVSIRLAQVNGTGTEVAPVSALTSSTERERTGAREWRMGADARLIAPSATLPRSRRLRPLVPRGAEHDQIGARLVRSLQQLVKGHPDRAEVLMRQPAFESLRAAASTLLLAARCRPRSMFAISAERRLLTVVGIMAMDDGRTGSSTLTTIARPRG